MTATGVLPTGTEVMLVTFGGYDFLAYNRGTTAATSYHRRGTNITASTSGTYQGTFVSRTAVMLEIDEVITDNNDVPYFKVMQYQTDHGSSRPATS